MQRQEFPVLQHPGAVGVLAARVLRDPSAATAPPIDDVYVDEPWLLLRWDNARRLVHAEWRAFANSAEFRAGLLKGIQAIKDHGAVAYMTDTRKVKVVVPDDQTWVAETWLPMATEAGLKRIAFVTAPAGLGKLTTEDVARLLDGGGLQSRIFDSTAEARNWVSDARVSTDFRR